MEQNQIVHGFTVLSGRRLDELEAVLWQLEHRRSGAQLVWLEREEKNKTFSIAFQTQPWDDTGVFHILEHSVLCGSDRYPVKEPFVELLKSSLNTYLNAATFPDMTMYPVSSRNDQDFVNLLRVYMDAVLHPLIHSKPEIFGQEGWHYELDGEGEPSYKGVVFNEMKGAMAAPDELLDSRLLRRLFPDTCYQYNAGGDPEHIPELTYEQFAAAHKRLYHPSNAYIFLDGRMDIDNILGILDGEYLAAYDRAPVPDPIPLQAAVDGGTTELVYELSAQESLEGRARLADGFVLGTFADREEITALEALADVLCGDNQAPLKRKMLENGLAKDVNLTCYSGSLQPRMTLEVKDVEEDKLEAVSKALAEELSRLVREGLDHRRILATLDNMEFQARQRDYGSTPQGLMLGVQVMACWLYGGDPAGRLEVGDLYDRLREKCGAGWFEELLNRALVSNPHRCRVIMRPSHTLGQERQAAETERLREARSGWSETETAAIRDQQARIETWQNTPDAPEQLAAIPMLRLDQIPSEPERLPIEETVCAGLPVLLHELPTGGITYLNLYFTLDDLTEEQISQVSLLAQLLGKLETEGWGLEELQRELRSRFGQIRFSVEAYSPMGSPERCRSFLCASCSVLDGKLESALELLSELLTRTKLQDPKRVSEFLAQRRAVLAEQLVMNGHLTSLSRVLARSSAESVVKENAEGAAFLRWLTELERAFSQRFPALEEALAALSGRVFCRARLTVSVTGHRPDGAETAAALLSARLPEGEPVPEEAPALRPWPRCREGIVIPSDVSYAAMGGVMPLACRGGTRAAGRVVSLDYLWNAVRVQGGAYGVGLVLWDKGLAGFYSYRDPSAGRTLDCYRASSDFLRSVGNMDMTGMIIGAVADDDRLLTPRLRGKTADLYHWRGMTFGDLCRLRREMLAAGPEDLAALAGALDALAEEASVCVLGPRKQLDACPGLEEITVL